MKTHHTHPRSLSTLALWVSAALFSTAAQAAAGGQAYVSNQAGNISVIDLATLEVTGHVSFLGHRTDLREIMAVSEIVYSLSHDPEAFGRVSLEALALGKPVIAYDHGGVAEQLRVIFPLGLVNPEDLECAVDLTQEILKVHPKPRSAEAFALDRMLRSTLEVYQTLLKSPRS